MQVSNCVFSAVENKDKGILECELSIFSKNIWDAESLMFLNHKINLRQRHLHHHPAGTWICILAEMQEALSVLDCLQHPNCAISRTWLFFSLCTMRMQTPVLHNFSMVESSKEKKKKRNSSADTKLTNHSSEILARLWDLLCLHKLFWKEQHRGRVHTRFSPSFWGQKSSRELWSYPCRPILGSRTTREDGCRSHMYAGSVGKASVQAVTWISRDQVEPTLLPCWTRSPCFYFINKIGPHFSCVIQKREGTFVNCMQVKGRVPLETTAS